MVEPHSPPLLLGHPTSGIPDVLVKLVFVHRSKDDFQEFAVWRALRLQPEHFLISHPRLRVRLRIVELYCQFQIVAVQAMPTFFNSHIVTERISPAIQPFS